MVESAIQTADRLLRQRRSEAAKLKGTERELSAKAELRNAINRNDDGAEKEALKKESGKGSIEKGQDAAEKPEAGAVAGTGPGKVHNSTSPFVINNLDLISCQGTDGTKRTSEELDGHNPKNWRTDKPKSWTWTAQTEPHAIRRREILKKYPQMKDLYGPDPLSAVFALATIVSQFIMAYYMRDQSWGVILFFAYAFGGFMNHSLVLAMHELSHDLFFPWRWANTFFGFICNTPTCVASMGTFRRYHLEHHSMQGSDKWDADIPTAIEGVVFSGWPGKMLWVFLQPFFYGVRPMLAKPKPVTMTEILNWGVVLTSNLLVVKFWGVKSLVYLFLGSILGLGLHPMSGHFIAEHFEFIEGQETYSYYGPLNVLAYNVGYHNEHHDFPAIPGRRLPKVKKIAPEFYDMPHYDSWVKVIMTYIFHTPMNGFCRIKRN